MYATGKHSVPTYRAASGNGELASPTVANVETASSPVSPSALVDLPVPANPRISPDGTLVVYQVAPISRAGDYEKTALWLAETATEYSSRQFTSGLHHDRLPQWCPQASRDLISFLSDRAQTGKSNALYCMKIDGGEAYPVTDVKCEKDISSYAWSPCTSLIAYISLDEDSEERKEKLAKKNDVVVYEGRWEYARLRLLDVGTKEASTIFAKDEHVLNFSWSPDGEKIVFSTVATPAFDSIALGCHFYVVDTTSQSVIQRIRFDGTLGGNLAWTRTGISFVAAYSQHNAVSSFALYSLSLKNGTCRREAYGISSCVSDIRSYGDGLFLRETAGMVDNFIRDGANLDQVDRQVTTWDARDLNNGEHMVAFCASDVSTPIEVYTHDQVGSKRLSCHGKAISNENYAEYHSISTRSFDRTTKLEGYFIAPKSRRRQTPLPTLVSIHGGPYYRLSNCFNPTIFNFSAPLVASGQYGILVPNYRGGAGYGEEYASSVRGAIGTVDYDDVIAMVEEGIKQGFVDKNRIVVSGWSNGGMLSYISAVRNGPGQAPRRIPDWRFAAAICGAGVADADLCAMESDVPSFEKDLIGTMPWLSSKENLQGRLGSAIWEMKKGAKDIPPMLLLHGGSDQRVPIGNAIAFFRGCKHYNVPCEFAMYPRENHIPEEREHRLDMLERVLGFISRHIGP